MRIRRKPPKKARIEIVPMIDTIFFLLVFFMVATTSMTVSRGMRVDLPTAGSVKEKVREKRSVTVTRDSRYYLDKEEVRLAGLLSALSADSETNPDMVVVINADREASHGVVVEVMDTVKRAGVTRLAIATEPKD